MAYHEYMKPSLLSFSGPVTALEVWSHKLLVGCGNEVSVYNISNFHLETKRQVLHGASIHGFSKGPFDDTKGQFVIVYGAKQACIIALKSKDGSKTELTLVSSIVHLSDWIWEAQWINYMGVDEILAFALAHNTVAIWDYRKSQIIHHQECVEKCILYCSHFFGDTWENLVVFGGTVYNQVILWLMSNDSQNANWAVESQKTPAPVLHTFTGHKGVIFSIKYHAEHQRLCSVSDDRSIHMWQIEFQNGETPKPSVNDWKSMQSSLLLSVFGHSARVWDVVLMTNYFTSIGEDATCCIWDYSGHVISKFKGHKGKSIWSITSTEDEQNVLTGGGDGSVRLWQVNTLNAESASQQSLNFSQISSMLDGDFPRIVTLLDFYTVLIMMNSGDLYSYTMRDERFDCIMKDSRFTSYSVLSSCPDKQTIAVGSIEGSVKILHLIPGATDNIPQAEESLFDGKVLGLVWLSQERLVASGPKGCCHVLRVTHNKSSDGSTTLHIARECSLFLPVSKHRWISAACLIDNPSVTSTKLIICGDKDGTIYSYQMSSEKDSDLKAAADVFQQPSQCFTKVHGKNGVTYLSFYNELLYSVGRDGYCRHWEVRDAELVQLHGSKVVKGFEWIDKLEWSNEDLLFYGFLSSQFVIWSQLYDQKLFCVECGGGHRSWGCSYSHGVFRFAYLKGGMVYVVDSAQCSKHEIFKPALHGKELHDVKLIKASEEHDVIPYFLTCTASEDTTINIGLYYNEFTQWKSLAALKGHLSCVRSLALSCETLKVSKHSLLQGSQASGSQKFEQERSDLKFRQKSMDFILFSGGGRAEIRVWKVNVKKNENYSENCDMSNDCSKTDRFVASGDVKKEESSVFFEDSVSCTHQEWSTHYLGESRHKRPYSKWKTRKLQLDPETRVMSLDASHVREILTHSCTSVACAGIQETNTALDNLHIVSAAGSDGLLRIFCYNDETRKLSSLAMSAFHEGCVLKVQHFLFKSKKEQQFLAFSTSTKGTIAVWSMDPIVTKAIEMENRINEPQEKEQLKQQCSNEKSYGQSNHCKNPGEDDKEDDDAKKKETSHEEETEKMDNFTPICSLQAHQSGINSIHAVQIDDMSLMLASGGDDNALTVQKIEVRGQQIKVASHSTNTSAHSAQITGVKLLSESLLVSGSIDQRICIWQLHVDGAEITMEMISCSYICLADVSCMDVCLHKNAVYMCLGGEGLCLYSWKPDGSEITTVKSKKSET